MTDQISQRVLRVASVAIVAFALSACGRPVSEVGRLSVVYAHPAERVEIYTLGAGQTFGGLLNRELSANEQANLLLAFREYADPRRMRERTEITLRYLPNEEDIRGIDVALSPDRTVRLDRDIAGWQSDLIQTPVHTDTLFASGEIDGQGSLWSAVVDNPMLTQVNYADRNDLIDHLDRVFQWSIDFSRQLRVGDTYRFAFEREVRPDGSMRAGRLLAAEFQNAGTPYHAVYFDPNGDGEGSYFDLEGESVRRAFLLKPLSYRRISGRFSNSRRHPILNTIRAHRGIDYAADAGTEIMATSDGVVIYRAPKGSFGNTVEIRHPNGWVTRYAHLRAFKNGVNVGTRVRQSDIIGYVGMTGLASGPHLHYEMLQNGRQFDPLSVDLPAGDPVPSDDMVRWRSAMDSRVALLETISRTGPVGTLVDDVPPGTVPDQPSGGGQR